MESTELGFLPSSVLLERSDHITHISNYHQSMALHIRNDALMCIMFPSILSPIELRWFYRLKHGSIHSWDKMDTTFVSHFIMNSRCPKEDNTLLSLSMKENESLKSYSSRYWELYKEVDRIREDLALKTITNQTASTAHEGPDVTDEMSQIEHGFIHSKAKARYSDILWSIET